MLVGEETHRRVAPVFAWSEPRELELKGKTEPVTAYRVDGVLAAPGYARELEAVQVRLVGRERELATAVEVVDAALAGAGGILFLTGEPGIGKTRLTAELRRHVEDASARRAAAPAVDRGPVRLLRRVDAVLAVPGSPALLARRPRGRARAPRAARAAADARRACSATRLLEVYPYLGAMLGLSLEPEARERLAELSPEALQYRTFAVIRELLARLAQDGPVFVVLEDLHWADPTTLQLLERLLEDTETSALLLVLSTRPERDHPSWRVKESAARELPHRTREVALEALSGDADRELLHALVGRGHPAGRDGAADPRAGRGEPVLPRGARPVARRTRGRSSARARGWRFDHAVEVEVPPTVEKVILARIDRLQPDAHDALMAASVLGRQFGLPLLEAVSGGEGEVQRSLLELQRLDLVRESRRWPEPEFRFKHVLIQEAAYRTLVTDQRTALHCKAAAWLEEAYAGREDEVAGLLAHHWLAAEDEDKAAVCLAARGGPGPPGVRARRGDRVLPRAAADPRTARGAARDRAGAVQARARVPHVAAVRGGERDVPAGVRLLDAAAQPPRHPNATLRIATSFLPNDPDPRSAIAWPNIQLCMQLFDRLVEAWPERTIVPSLAERWEISDDGLRYVFHLREGLRWSDGEPLTAHDVEFGIKRVLNPDAPGSSVAIYFVLENGQDYYLRRNDGRRRDRRPGARRPHGRVPSRRARARTS